MASISTNIAPRGKCFAITARPPSLPATLPPKLMCMGWSTRAEAETTCAKLPEKYQCRVVLVDELRAKEEQS